MEHPGVFIRDALEARGWTEDGLARALGCSVQTVISLIDGKRSVNADLAACLSRTFGTSAELWLNLQAQYDSDH